MNKIENENVLMVEGKDEKNFFDALLKTVDIHNIQIIDVGGKDSFRNKFSAYIQTEGALAAIKNIGFIRDAEEKEAASAFQSICSIISKYDLPRPKEIGKIAEQDGKRASVFIMPNNKDCGMLEDLCLTSIKDTDIFRCVECFIRCYENKIKKDAYNITKARILAYLSTQIPIVTSLGIAAKSHVWDFSNACFDDIKKFLKELFT